MFTPFINGINNNLYLDLMNDKLLLSDYLISLNAFKENSFRGITLNESLLDSKPIIKNTGLHVFDIFSSLLTDSYIEYNFKLFDLILNKNKDLFDSFNKDYLFDYIYQRDLFRSFSNFDELCKRNINKLDNELNDSKRFSVDTEEKVDEYKKELNNIKSNIIKIFLIKFNKYFDTYLKDEKYKKQIFDFCSKNIMFNNMNYANNINANIFNNLTISNLNILNFKDKSIDIDYLNTIIDVIKYNLMNDINIYKNLALNFGNISSTNSKYLDISNDIFVQILLSIFKNKNKDNKSLGENLTIILPDNSSMNIERFNKDKSNIYLDLNYSYNYFKYIQEYPKENTELQYRIEIGYNEDFYFNSVAYVLMNPNVIKNFVESKTQIKFKSVKIGSTGIDAGGVCRAVFSNLFKDITEVKDYEVESITYGMKNIAKFQRKEYLTERKI